MFVLDALFFLLAGLDTWTGGPADWAQRERGSEMLQRQETFSSLAEWAFADACSPPSQAGSGGDAFPPLQSEEKLPSLSASFSALPLDELLPELVPDESPRDWPSSPRNIDPCKLAALSPEEEAEVCSKLQVDKVSEPASAPEFGPTLEPEPRTRTEPLNERKRARGDAALAQQNPRHPNSIGSNGVMDASTGEAAVRRELMAMNVHMQMEAQVRLYRLLLALRRLEQRNLPHEYAGLIPTPAYREELAHLEAMKSTVLQQSTMVRHMMQLITMEEIRIKRM